LTTPFFGNTLHDKPDTCLCLDGGFREAARQTAALWFLEHGIAKRDNERSVGLNKTLPPQNRFAKSAHLRLKDINIGGSVRIYRIAEPLPHEVHFRRRKNKNDGLDSSGFELFDDMFEGEVTTDREHFLRNGIGQGAEASSKPGGRNNRR
jgi:hypothetical protein